MSFAVGIIGMVEVIVGIMGFGMFLSEAERWPGQYLRWTPYLSGNSYRDTAEIIVGVRRKGEKVALLTLDPRLDGFDEQLHAAQAAARERCIELNVARRHLTRRLPR